MREIDLTRYQNEPISGHTSKGDQPKWNVGDLWYKADHMGHEGLSEAIVSWMLAHSTVDDFVRYEPLVIHSVDGQYVGCRSRNFRRDDEMLIPLEKLHRAYHGIGLAAKLAQFPEVEDRIRYTVSFVEETTGLSDFGIYLGTLLELDAFILNEDRHTNNIAVIRNEKTGKFRLCPIFDNGLSFLSDLKDYPLDLDLYQCIEAVAAKPFSVDFGEQLEAANRVCKSGLRFRFTKTQLQQALWELAEYYDARIIARVEQVILEQMRKYGYLF